MSSKDDPPLRLGLATRASAWLAATRWVAWAALIGVTTVLVRAETLGPEVPNGVASYTGVVYRRVGSRRVLLDVYVPKGKAPLGGRPAVVALHGGGWRGGSRTTYGREAARL